MSNEVVGQFPVPPLYFVHFGGVSGAERAGFLDAGTDSPSTLINAPSPPPVPQLDLEVLFDANLDYKIVLTDALNDLVKTTLCAVSHVAGSPESVMAQKVLIDSKVAAMFKVLSEYKHHEGLVKLLRHMEQQLGEVNQLQEVLQRALKNAETKLSKISSS